MGRLEDTRLMAKIATLYHEKGMKQADIAQRLYLSQSFVSRALNRALKEHIVKITVLQPSHVHIALEQQLQEQYHLDQVIVVEADEQGGEQAIRWAIGSAAAHYLETTLSSDDSVGISSWSSTIRSMVSQLHPFKFSACNVVQLLGGVGSKGAFEATLLTQQLGKLLNCDAHLLPAQSIEQSVDSKQRLVAQPDIEEVLQLFNGVTLALVGIGNLEPSQLLKNSGNYYHEDMLRLLAERQATGDICLHYFDQHGKPVLSAAEDPVIGMELDKLRHVERVVGLAGGEHKVNAIRSAMNGGYLDVLITDHQTAQALAATD